MNPFACAGHLEKIANENGLDLNIAVVTGDDLMSQVKKLNINGIF